MAVGKIIKRAFVVGAVLGAGLSLAGAAFADELGEGGAEAPFAAWSGLAEAELEGLRGGADVDIDIDVDQSQDFNNNTATNVTSGDITISNDAFGSLDGFQAIVINSGNNVAIQNSMTVTVVLF